MSFQVVATLSRYPRHLGYLESGLDGIVKCKAMLCVRRSAGGCNGRLDCAGTGLFCSGPKLALNGTRAPQPGVLSFALLGEQDALECLDAMQKHGLQPLRFLSVQYQMGSSAALVADGAELPGVQAVAGGI